MSGVLANFSLILNSSVQIYAFEMRELVKRFPLCELFSALKCSNFVESVHFGKSIFGVCAAVLWAVEFNLGSLKLNFMKLS